MPVEPAALVAIVGMAVATYVTRAGGLWLMGRITLSERVEAWLRHVPGATLAAIVAPDIFAAGTAGIGATLVVVAIAVRTGSPLAAMVAGVGALLGFRAFL